MNLEEFKNNVANGSIKDKWYFYKRTEDNKNALVRDMNSLVSFIKDKLNLDIYLVYGTLLGAIRENDFIEHDNDVDFAYLSRQNNKDDVLNEFYAVQYTLKNHDLLSKKCSNGHLHVYSPNKRNKFDLWTSFILDNKYSIVPIVDAEIDSSLILPFKTTLFRQYSFLIPNNPPKYLSSIYENWTIPILDKKGTKNKWKKLL